MAPPFPATTLRFPNWAVRAQNNQAPPPPLPFQLVCWVNPVERTRHVPHKASGCILPAAGPCLGPRRGQVQPHRHLIDKRVTAEFFHEVQVLKLLAVPSRLGSGRCFPLRPGAFPQESVPTLPSLTHNAFPISAISFDGKGFRFEVKQFFAQRYLCCLSDRQQRPSRREALTPNT